MLRNLFSYIIISFAIISSANAQGDDCSTATDIGVLPTPTACGGPSGGEGAPVNVSFDNTALTVATPYLSMLGCSNGAGAPGGDMASPAIDGWYSFTATGTNLEITFTGNDFTSTSIGLWSGTCGNLTANFCDVFDAGVTPTLNYQPLVVGTTYYIQISGSNTDPTPGNGGVDVMTFDIENNFNCAICTTEGVLTVDPPPVNGTYAPGQTVDFCFELIEFEQQETNWFHAVQTAFGDGWAESTAEGGPGWVSNPVPPTDCGNTSGDFVYSTDGATSDATGDFFGPGFYYESTSGCPGFPQPSCDPAEPGDNWGLSNAGDCDELIFCWQLTVPADACTSGASSDLSVTVGTTADGESGSWSSPACSNDADFILNASLACCLPPVLTPTSVTCPSTADGSVTVTSWDQADGGPWDFYWYDDQGNQIGSETNVTDPPGPADLTGLGVGEYFIIIEDNNGCFAGASAIVDPATPLTVDPQTVGPYCAGENINISFTGQGSPDQFNWTIDDGSLWGAGGSGTGSISTTAVNATGASITANITVTPQLDGPPVCLGTPEIITITVNPSPVVTLSAPNTSVCDGQSVDITGSYTPQPSTNQLSFENNSIVAIPQGNCSGQGCDFSDYASSTVTTSGVAPTTLIAGQIVSICATIRHECPDDLTDSGSGEVWFYANGNFYTSANPATNSEIFDELTDIYGAGNEPIVYSSALASDFQAAIDAAEAAAIAAGGSGCDNGTVLTFDFCLPQAIIDDMVANGTPANGDWFFGFRDMNSGPTNGSVSNMTVIINDYDIYNYDWTANTTGLSNPVPSPYTGTTTGGDLVVTATPTTDQTYTLSITDANGCTGTGTIDITVLPVPVAPTVTPVTPICAGADAVFNIAAEADNADAVLTYNITSPTPAVNGQTATLANDGSGTITISTTTSQTQDVTIELVSISNGPCSTPLTGTYTVTVNPIPTMNTPGNIVVCPTQSINVDDFVSVPAGATFDWTNSNTSIGLGASGSGQIATYAAPANATGAAITGNIQVTPELNNCPGSPVNFTITINPTPVVNPISNLTTCGGNVDPVAFTSAPAGATFTWTNSNTGTGLVGNNTINNDGGDIDPFSTPTAINETGSDIVSTVTVTPTLAGCPGTPLPFTITWYTTPDIDPITPFEVCSGITDNVDVTLSANEALAAGDYSWTLQNIGNITGASAGSGNPITQTLTNTNTDGTTVETIDYVVSATNGNCVGQTTFTVTVNPTPLITPDANTVCLNSTVDWTGSATAASPAWSIVSGPGAVTFGTNASANPVTLTGTAVGDVTIQYENDNGCVITDVLSVLPLPSVTSFVPVATPICFNGTAEWDIVASPNSDITYTVTGGGAYTDPNGGTVTTNGSGNATVTLTGATADVTVTLNSIDNGSCVVTLNNPQTIPVIPAPTMNDPADITVCGGVAYDPETFVVLPALSGYAESYQWTNDNTAIGLGASGSGQIGSTTAPANATGDPIVGTVTVTPYLGACPGTSQDFVVTINPTPVMDDPSNIGPVCVGASVDPAAFVGNANAPVTTTYAWSNNNTGTGLGANGTDADIPSFTATNGGATTIISTVTVTPTYTNNSVSCVGAPQQFTITVDPVPVVNNLSLTVCEDLPAGSGVASGIDLTANNSNVSSVGSTYDWTIGGNPPAPSVGSATVSNGDVYDVLVTTANNCTNTATVTYTVTSGITVNSPTITLCEDALGGGTVAIADLATYNNNMFAGGTTYTWTASGGGAPALVPASTTTPGGVTASNGYAYDVEVVQGSCPAVTGTITFQVDGQVTAGTNGAIDFCSSDAAVNLYDELGTLPTPTLGGAWSGLSGLANGDQGTFDPSTDLQDTYTYDVLSGNSCPDASATVAVTVTPAVYAGDGGTFQLCQSATAVENLGSYNGNTLGAITPGGTWTVNVGLSTADPGVNFDGPNGTIDPTGLPIGDYVFEYAVTAATVACPNDMAQITMTIIGNITLNDPMPVLCEDVAGGGQVVGHDLTIYNDPGVFVGGDSYLWTGGNTQTITNGQTINIQVTSGTCINDIDVTFTVDPQPTASTLNSGLTCETTSYTLPAGDASASNGTISWAVTTGSGTITPGTETTLTPEYNPVAADAGTTVTLEMTVTSNNSCGGTATATYDIVIDPLPQAATAPIGAAAICETAGSYTLQPGEATSVNGTVQWTHDGFGSLSGGTTLEPTYNAGVGDAGNTVTLTLTVTSNNSCTGEIATATYPITVEPQPTASTINSGVTCSTAPYTLPVGDATSSNGTIAWTVQSGNGTITAGANTLTPEYTPTIADEGTTVTLLMTVSNGGACSDATTTYDIVVDVQPTATAGGNTAICEGDSYTLAPAEATATGGTIQWTHDGAGNITLATINTEEPEYISAAGDAGNAVTMTMTVDAGNTCPAAVATYTINVDIQPTATAGGSTSICEGTSYTLQGGEASSANGTILWTVQSGNGTITAGTETGLTPEYVADPLDVNTTVTLLMTVTNGGSCPDATATYTIDVTPLPTLVVTDPAPACEPSAVDITFASVTNGSDPGTLTYWTDNPPTNQLTTVQAQSLTDNTYYIQLEDALGCTSIEPVVVTVNTQPTFTFDTLTPSACNLTDGNITLSGLVASSDYDVDVFDGTTTTTSTITTDGAGDLVIPNLGAGTYEVNVTLVSTGCVSSVSIIDIDNPGAPILDAINDTTVCDLFNLEVITGTGLTGNESYWDGSGATGTQYNVGDPITSTMTMYAYDVNGICSDEVSFVITVNTTPVLDQPNDTTVCDTYTLEPITGTNTTAGAAHYNNWPSAGGTVITGPLTSSQTVYVHDADGTCADSVSFVVTVDVTPTITVTDPAAVCEPNLVDASGAATTDVGVLTFYSDAGLTTVVDETQLNTGTYYVEAVNNGCSSSDMINVTVNLLPSAPTAGIDSVYCSSWMLENMLATGTGGTLTWYYDPTGGSIGTGGTFAPDDVLGTTDYYVTETLNGCEGPASMVTITIENCEITIPTAITPNGDQMNDTWEVVDLDAVYPDNVVQIYNRWGSLIFEHISNGGSTPYSGNQWDGTYEGNALPVGSYYYVIQMNDEDGTVATGAVSIVLD